MATNNDATQRLLAQADAANRMRKKLGAQARAQSEGQGLAGQMDVGGMASKLAGLGGMVGSMFGKTGIGALAGGGLGLLGGLIRSKKAGKEAGLTPQQMRQARRRRLFSPQTAMDAMGAAGTIMPLMKQEQSQGSSPYAGGDLSSLSDVASGSSPVGERFKLKKSGPLNY